jgi:hypothetical protein
LPFWHGSEADEALREGILGVLETFLQRPPVMDKAALKQRLSGAGASVEQMADEIFGPIGTESYTFLYRAQISCSVILELCRYRRGW